MFGRLHHWSSPCEFAFWVYKLGGVQQSAALVALVASGIFVAALGTSPDDKSVRQELPQRLREQLLHFVLDHVVALHQFRENLLSYFGLMSGRGAAEFVAADFEPLVDFFVNFVVFLADLFAADSFLVCLRRAGQAVSRAGTLPWSLWLSRTRPFRK